MGGGGRRHVWIMLARALVLCMAASALAEETGRSVEAETRISGAARINYFRSDNHLDDKADFLGATLGTSLEARLDHGFDARFELRATRPEIFRQGEGKVSFIEAYLGWRNESMRVRLGKQIVAWGRTDGINPTDNLTPRDYVVLLPFEEDQRFGTRALNVDGFLGDDHTLSLFITPFFAPSKIPLPIRDANFVDQQPHKRLAEGELGVRFSKAGGAFDWSLSYFHGYNLFPELRPVDFMAGRPAFALHYARMNVLGADFSTNVGRYGLRGELAYFRMTDRDSVDPLSRKSNWYYVIGGDRTFDGSLNVNLQLFGRVVQEFQDPHSVADPSLRSLAVLDAILGGQQDRFSHGMTARISKTWLNDMLRAELLSVLHFTRRNWYLRPLVSYDASDNVKLSVGANLYSGGDDTFFGRLRKDSGLFAELRYAF